MRKSNISLRIFSIFYLIGICVIILSCDSNKSPVTIKYYPRGTTSSVPITCEMLDSSTSRFVKDTIIKNRDFYQWFISEVNKLEPGPEKPFSHDFRVKFVFRDREGNIHYLCCGEYFDILLDGEQMKESIGFYKLLNSTLFDER